MAAIPEVTGIFSRPVTIDVQPWFRDHRFAGKVILPAVETLAVLSAEVKKCRPDVDVSRMYDANFAKFLQIGPDEKELRVTVELHPHNRDLITAKLKTKIRKKTITRGIEHGRVTFSSSGKDLPAPASPIPFDLAASSCHAADQTFGAPMLVDSEKIYRDLVPFGKSYQNIIGAMHVNEQGAWARLMAPDLPLAAPASHTGSPFPLDAAFHAACVWGQRYAGFIPFPMGFASRIISRCTEPATTYETRVIPMEIKADELVFDLWIYNSQGELFETVSGIKMRDVSGGRLKPPAWIKIDPCVAPVI